MIPQLQTSDRLTHSDGISLMCFGHMGGSTEEAVAAAQFYCFAPGIYLHNRGCAPLAMHDDSAPCSKYVFHSKISCGGAVMEK